MCGRYAATKDPAALIEEFAAIDLTEGRARVDHNVAPTKNVVTVVQRHPRDAEGDVLEDEPAVRSLRLMRWGLVPFWAKDIKVGFANINAKAEGIDTKPAFREAFARRRCLIPFDCFYEWKKLGKDREPYAVGLADRKLMALAGLWETWRSPAGERVRSFAIVTTAANDLLAPIHDRMPVILAPGNWPVWLGERPADPQELKSLLVPYPADDIAVWPVDKRVGNVNNKDPALIEPAAVA